MEGIEQLRQAVGVLSESEPGSLTDDELGDTLVEWQRLESRLAAAKARFTAAFETRGGWRADGSKTAAGWLARRCGASLRVARAQTRLARRLGRMPATWAALAAGEITETHAWVLAGLYGSPRKPVADAFGAAEVDLVGYATGLGFEEFVTAVRYWETAVDPDGAEHQAADDHASRHVHLSQTLRGNWALDGQLDPLAGEELSTALRRIEHELFLSDWTHAKATHGTATCLEHLARTPAQRRADALVEMARRATATAADTTRPRPLLVVHLGDDSLRRLCELASGRVIAPGALIPLLADADIERIVYAGASRRVIDLGRRTRFFTGALRRAIQHRDRRCQHPGCRTPAQDCDIDHVQPYTKGGPTTQDNGQARCPHHNRFKSDNTPPDTNTTPQPHDTS